MATSQASLNEGVETLASVIADPKKESNAENGDNETSESESFQNNIPKRMSVFSYVMSELTRGYLLERDKDTFTERRQRVYTFMRTPRELEKFLLYGVLQCVDTFLFIFTFLPLRIVLASLKILTHPCGVFIRRSHNVLEPAQICDILKGIILVVCLVIVNHIDTSMMYHLVRGQAVIKLYVFFNMLEMADRLFSSFGQDILDALFWTATEPRGRKRDHLGTIPHLILAIIYFVEIKGSMFRKIDSELLYHISCSDSKERFHYVILLSVVFIRNMAEFNWDPDQVWVIIPDAVLVLVAEVMVDWIKHAFILKFNETKADVYRKFTVRLAKDMISNRQSRAFIDYSDQVSRRMTLTPLPVACLLLRICTKSFKISGHIGILIIVVLYFCLLTLKIMINILLMGRAYDVLSKDAEENQASQEEKSSNKSKGRTELTRSQSDCRDHRPDIQKRQSEFKNIRKTQSVSFTPSMYNDESNREETDLHVEFNQLEKKNEISMSETTPVLIQSVPPYKKESKFTHLRYRKISEAEDIPKSSDDSSLEGLNLDSLRNSKSFKTESSV